MGKKKSAKSTAKKKSATKKQSAAKKKSVTKKQGDTKKASAPKKTSAPTKKSVEPRKKAATKKGTVGKEKSETAAIASSTPTASTSGAPRSKTKGPSAIEGFKAASNYLRGDLAAELVDGKAFFSEASIQLINHHGSYEQGDRDQSAAVRKDGVLGGKDFSLMVRTAVPGGKLTSEQLLAELNLCDEVGNGTLRITTRQGLQLHGISKTNLKRVIRRINEIGLTTLAACGDVRRNVMCTPAPFKLDPVHAKLQGLADELALRLRPQTAAYREIWLTDNETGEKEKVTSIDPPADTNRNEGDSVEPLYGPTYLPRKFKLAVGLPGDNSVDLYANDCGFLAVCENFDVVGYNVLVGGGFGVTPGSTETFPAVAQPMCFVTPDQTIGVAAAVIKLHRDHGDRCDRERARLKYILHDWGMAKFKATVERYFGAALPKPRPVVVFGHDDGLGWREQGDGRWFYGLNVENGRIKDDGEYRLKSALREICRTLTPPLRLTPHQAIILTDIAPDDRDRLEEILRRHGVPLTEEITNVRRWSMSCPALPTCGLAVTESERVFPGIIDALEDELDRFGLSGVIFTTRMTGCPSGCARPYNAGIGLVGESAGKYTVLLGGRTLGDRLNFIYRASVPAEDVVATLVPVFEEFKSHRENGESFGDFCWRRKEELLS